MIVQIFGTRLQMTLGNLQLRIGISLENQSSEGMCDASDEPVVIADPARTAAPM